MLAMDCFLFFFLIFDHFFLSLLFQAVAYEKRLVEFLKELFAFSPLHISELFRFYSVSNGFVDLEDIDNVELSSRYRTISFCELFLVFLCIFPLIYKPGFRDFLFDGIFLNLFFSSSSILFRSLLDYLKSLKNKDDEEMEVGFSFSLSLSLSSFFPLFPFSYS